MKRREFLKTPSLCGMQDREPAFGKFTEVVMGNVDFEAIFASEDPSDMKYYFVELDVSKRPALESIKISFDYLNKADFVR